MSTNSRQRAAIIGAGIIGVTAARALQREGHEVTLFDPGGPGDLCSFGNAGNIAIDHVRPLARLDVLAQVPRMLANPLGPLCLKWAGLPRVLPWLWRFTMSATPGREARATRALGDLLGMAQAHWADEIRHSALDDLFVSQGALVVYEKAESLAASRKEAELMRAHGVRIEMLDEAAIRAQVPGLAVQVAGGRYYPDAGHVIDPHGLVRRLAARFVAEGGIIQKAAVTGFEFADGRVTRLVTGSGSHPVDQVVLAAGLASKPLAEMLGARTPITGERGYHVMIDPGALPCALSTTFADRGFIATPMSMGMRLAGTVELGYGTEPDWRRAEQLVTHARALTGRASLAAESRWHGERPTLPDFLPSIGLAPKARNAICAFGHQHIGLTLAAVTGRLVGDLVAGRPRPLDLAPFAPARFGTC